MDKSKFAVSTYNKVADAYSKQYFDDLSDTPYIDKFLTLLPLNSKILEVGCGPGQFVKYLIEKGYKAEGIDLSEEMIRIAKEKVPQGKFQVMDMRKLNFNNESFDGILTLYSLIHIPSEEINLTLKEFARVLKPSRYVFLIVHKGKADNLVEEPFKMSEKMFINFFTKDRLSKFITDAGFGVEYLEEKESQDSRSMSNRIIYAIVKKL